MTRKRWLGLLVAALIVPLPAFALTAAVVGLARRLGLERRLRRRGRQRRRLQAPGLLRPIDGATLLHRGRDRARRQRRRLRHRAVGRDEPAPYVGNGDLHGHRLGLGREAGPRAPQAAGHRLERPRGHVRHARATVRGLTRTRGRNVEPDAPRDRSHTDASNRSTGVGTGVDASVDVDRPERDRHLRARRPARRPLPPRRRPRPRTPGHGLGDNGSPPPPRPGSPPARLPGPQDPACCTTP